MQRLRALLIGAIALLSLAVSVFADSAWSQIGKTIKVVISVPPGGTIDLLVRVLADHIGKTQGQTIIVESRPGAGSIIARRSGGAGGTRWRHIAGQQQRHDDQLENTQGEFRSADEL